MLFSQHVRSTVHQAVGKFIYEKSSDLRNDLMKLYKLIKLVYKPVLAIVNLVSALDTCETI